MSIAIRSARKSIQVTRAAISMVRASGYGSSAVDKNPNPQNDAVPSGHYYRHRFEYQKPGNPKRKVYDYYMDLGGLEPARFAIEEFNKLKNAQLQFVRVVRSQRRVEPDKPGSDRNIYFITLEAVDAGVVKTYRAKVSVNLTCGMYLDWFCLDVGCSCPVPLYDDLDNLFAYKNHDKQEENHIPECKMQERCRSQESTYSNKKCFIPCDIQPLKGVVRRGHRAVEMFNKEKNAQLQFLRVVRAATKQEGYGVSVVYLTLEAADAGVVKSYQAELVELGSYDYKYWLKLFGVVENNGTFLVLIDNEEECAKVISESINSDEFFDPDITEPEYDEELPCAQFLLDIKVALEVTIGAEYSEDVVFYSTRNETRLKLDLWMYENTSRSVIARELSRLNVPLQICGSMVDKIVSDSLCKSKETSSSTHGMMLHMNVSIHVAVFLEPDAVEVNIGEPVLGPASKSSIDELESSRVEKSTICPICLEEMMAGTEATRLPCSHLYHGSCIVKWLERKRFCPMCRFSMPIG